MKPITILWTTLLFLMIILIQLQSNQSEALEGSRAAPVSKSPSSPSSTTHSKQGQKVKCKEKVDEALRQYFKDEDDEDDDDDDDDNKSDANDEDDGDKNEDALEDHRPSKHTDKDDDDDDDDDNDSDDHHHDSKKKRQASDEDDSDEKDDDDDDDEPHHPKGTKKNPAKHDDDEDDDDDDDDDDHKHNRGKKHVQDDDDDDDDDEPAPKKKNAPAAKKNPPAKNTDDDDDDDDEDDDPPAPPPKKSAKKNPPAKKQSKEDDDDDDDEDDDQEKEMEHQQKRSRAHIDDILKVYEIGSQDDNAEQNLIQSIFRDLKRMYESTVKPLEMIYKYRQITTRLITDAEIFSKPMVLFLGGKSVGKSSLVNYLLGIDGTPWQIPTGASSQTKFTILTYGENYTRLSPIELAADFQFSSLQRFGEQFLADYIDARRLPINILQKMVIVDSPGLIDMVPTQMAKQTIDNDVYQWFIDRSDVIYVVIDVSQLHLSTSLRALLDQLKGREVRFIISKADIASHSQIISMFGQLLWVLSPIMSHERPPKVYALSTMPQEEFDEFIDQQETAWLKDLSQQISGLSRIESHIAELRRHAVRARNHAKLIDCYLATFYKNKGLFTFGSSSKQLATDIAENPHQYRIYSGAFMGQLQNVSRYDLPDPGVYREFFRSNSLIDFKPLSSTCSYFRGCPIDRLDVAIAYDLPELVSKYKKLTKTKLDEN